MAAALLTTHNTSALLISTAVVVSAGAGPFMATEITPFRTSIFYLHNTIGVFDSRLADKMGSIYDMMVLKR